MANWREVYKVTKCEFCKAEFEKSDPDQRFCSFTHKRAGYQERKFGRAFAERWLSRQEREPIPGDSAGLIAELDQIRALPTIEEIAELIPDLKSSTRVSDWPEDEKTAYRNVNWDSFAAREKWMAQYRRMKVAAKIVRLLERRAKGAH